MRGCSDCVPRIITTAGPYDSHFCWDFLWQGVHEFVPAPREGLENVVSLWLIAPIAVSMFLRPRVPFFFPVSASRPSMLRFPGLCPGEAEAEAEAGGEELQSRKLWKAFV